MIIVRLDRIMADRKVSLNELSDAVGISTTNLSLLKNGKVKGIRFETIDKICNFLDCNISDILEYSNECK